MAMKVTSARFVACVTTKEALPPRKLPIIALVGRSNVGKSSLINILANRRELAKTSSTPGKTLTINFYEFNEAFYLVDLPGYGYSKVSKVSKERIQKMMNEFFEALPDLAGIVQVLDIRHPPSNMDLSMFRWIMDQGFRYLPVLTKADKLGAQELAKMKKTILGKLSPGWNVLFSTKTRQGREELLENLRQLLENPEAGSVKAREKSGEEGQRRKRFGGRDQPRPDRGDQKAHPKGPRPPHPPRRPLEPGTPAQADGQQVGTAADGKKDPTKPPHPSSRRRRRHHRGGKPQGAPPTPVK